MRKPLTAEQAAALVPDGATVMIGGFLGVGSPKRVIDALVARGAKGLTVIGNDTGRPDLGIGRLIVAGCVARGLSVIQGDADTDLTEYPDDSFDYVILSQTIQATRNPRFVLEQMLRIGRHAIVSFPNFGHWRMRSQVFFQGRMPVTDSLPYAWWDTPNIHFCTIRDFVTLCDQVGARKERAVALDAAGGRVGVNAPWWFWNLFGAQAVFLLKRG